MNDDDALPFGLYELVESAALPTHRFPPQAQADWAEVDEAERISVLSRYVAAQLEQRLKLADKKDRVDIVNQALAGIQPDDAIRWGAKGELRQLVALRPSQSRRILRPETPLSDAALLTNGPQQPSLSREIVREMASADRVDLLCSFLKVSGINVLWKALAELRARGVPLRVITTTYMGATDAKAVHILHDMGAEVKVSYLTTTTRLHAKAWLFERDSGFSTGYVGSSNLSAAAMTDGLEWNVRLSNALTPGVLSQFRATFDSYWSNPEFVTYEPDQRDELDRALRRATDGDKRTLAALDMTFLDVYPRPHQALMLDHLAAERSRGHHRNLVVAATGTGKTILSALDFRALSETLHSPTLLFVAHREKILTQARQAFQAVMRKRSFGDMLVGGARPRDTNHVFASIQSLSRGWLTSLPRDHFDIVIIDEFHHADAATYRAVLDYLEPKELIGLTATPERGDGVDVAEEFFDGRIATELRLWDALDADLLVPFHYFGIDDGTDLSRLKVTRGAYETEALNQIYVDDEEGSQGKTRLRIIAEELDLKVADPKRMKALGFCASKVHARFMAEAFNRLGIAAVSLVGEDPEADRIDAIERLRSDDDPLAVIFTVDIFNEGVDIPDVDTLLMLRPTESPTLFQQQLGRGLRRAPRKSVLTVLDFVGNHSGLYRFEKKYKAFVRGGRLTAHAVTGGFPDLPAGCSVELDEITQQHVIANIKQSLSISRPKLFEQVRELVVSDGTRRPVEFLPDFLLAYGHSFATIYRGKQSRSRGGKAIRCTWNYALSQSGVEDSLADLFADDAFIDINNRVHALTHVNDPVRQTGYLRLLRGTQSERGMGEVERRLAWMLVFSVWMTGRFTPSSERFTLDEALERLRRYPAVADELEQVWRIVEETERRVIRPERLLEGKSPLMTHGVYSREELFAGLAAHETSRIPSSFVEGVLESATVDAVALLVTLEKNEKHYSPQTMYKDYALTDREFAWDSQNSTTPDSRKGLMYRGLGEDARTPLLFVRRTKTSQEIPDGIEPYVFLGPVSYMDHEGSQPMHITWKLERAMPAELFNVARVAA
ncbi:DUF3427 domain-containing protein [Flaviflexus equikiangi]|uniref:DUF3427 domain-containing protein n=1 Tax=Flaviflexus equikiangi TaxID=2758573 RepID=UPI0015F66AEB|nr:DUF3427 domain-containing protein [Flaviflexus equikiangi]